MTSKHQYAPGETLHGHHAVTVIDRELGDAAFGIDGLLLPSVNRRCLDARRGATVADLVVAVRPRSGYIGRGERTSFADLAALVLGRFSPDLVQRDYTLASARAGAAALDGAA